MVAAALRRSGPLRPIRPGLIPTAQSALNLEHTPMPSKSTVIRDARAAAKAAGVGLYSRAGMATVRPLLSLAGQGFAKPVGA